MIDLHRESATDPFTAHRISEIDRALSLIRGVIASQYRFMDGHAQSDLSAVAGILLVERALIQRTTPQTADPAEDDEDPRCVCGTARSEHALCGCSDGFQRANN